MGIFSFLKNEPSNNAGKVEWVELTDVAQLANIREASKNKAQVVFKHSTRCSISSMALTRFEREGAELNELADLYYLDLITYRPVSNAIAEETGVEHQSPQCIVLKNDEVIYQSSHSSISAQAIIDLLK